MSTTGRLDRAGIPAEGDLEDPEVLGLRAEMQAYQDTFLEKVEPTRSAEYKWPRDALNWWSRRWEYPFALHHLRRTKPDRVLDIGPGVCFFPFFVAEQGIDLTACDIDPVVVGDFRKAADVCDLAGRARCVEGPLDALPFPDASFDLVYSISVVEHVPFRPDLFDDLVRVVRPGGELVLTLDVALKGDEGVTLEQCRTYTDALEAHFEPVFPIDWNLPTRPLGFDKARKGSALRVISRNARRWLGVKKYPRMVILGLVYRRRAA